LLPGPTRQALAILYQRHACTKDALEYIEITIVVVQENTSAAEVQRALKQIAEILLNQASVG
jgi:hypothetical protein